MRIPRKGLESSAIPLCDTGERSLSPRLRSGCGGSVQGGEVACGGEGFLLDSVPT